MERLIREVGNWVTGDRFWDREQELSDLAELISEGAHILLVAPRRVGKTSIMRELADRHAETFLFLYVDLQRALSPADAIVELCLATKSHVGLWHRTTEVFRNVLASVDSLAIDELKIKLRDGVAADWQSKGERLFDALAASDKPVVLLLDELPILVNRLLRGSERAMNGDRIRETDAFVSWLRGQTIRHRGKLRLVVSGSIGLEPILRQAGLSASINTLTSYELRPWDPATALGCLRALANQYKLEFEDGTAEHMIEKLGSCIPHHVQMFFSHVYTESKRRGSVPLRCSVQLVDAVYTSSMLSSRGHAELSHFEERLRMVIDDADVPLALDLLTEAAETGRLTPEAAAILVSDHTTDARHPIGFAAGGDRSTLDNSRLNNLLAIFEHDGYLRDDGAGYVFISRLLRDWWKARFGFGYVRSALRNSAR